MRSTSQCFAENALAAQAQYLRAALRIRSCWSTRHWPRHWPWTRSWSTLAIAAVPIFLGRAADLDSLRDNHAVQSTRCAAFSRSPAARHALRVRAHSSSPRSIAHTGGITYDDTERMDMCASMLDHLYVEFGMRHQDEEVPCFGFGRERGHERRRGWMEGALSGAKGPHYCNGATA